jgi:hypothetical protein
LEASCIHALRQFDPALVWRGLRYYEGRRHSGRHARGDMSKVGNHAIKSLEKFKKSSEKEIERLDRLEQKSSRLASVLQSHPVLNQYFDRLKQKRQQLVDDLVWSEQVLDQVRIEFAKQPKADEKKKPEPQEKKAKSAEPKTKAV